MGVNVKKIGLAALAGVSLQLGQMIAPAAADDALPSYGEAVWEQVARAIASPTKTNVDAAADRLVRLASEQPARYRAIDGRVLLISLADAHREQGRLAEALNVIIRVYTFDRAAYPNGVSLNEMLEVIDTMSDLLVENRRFAEALQYRFNAYEFDRDARRGTEPGTAVKSAALRGAAYLRFEKSIDDRPDLTAAERRAVEAFKRDYITPQVRRELGVGVADDAPDAKNADEAQRSVGFLSTHKLVRIFYGTNRRVASRHDANNPYGAEVGPLELGVVSINVPKSVLDDPTRIAPPNSLVFTVRGSGVEGLIVENIASYTENAFVSTLKSEMRASKRKELIVFVHGYNTSFRAAVERAATMKIGLDNVGNGSVALYSWPSGGSLYDYSEDRALISNNTVLGGLQRYLLLLMRESGAERVHLIAHSMGNEFLLEALSR
ncbi:MAG: alpha/beta hydrolase, partial [Pseudomonadota bacterium]